MKVSDRIQVQVTLLPGKEPLVPIEQDAWWAPGPLLMVSWNNKIWSKRTSCPT